ncbi:MAG: HAD-IIB family hydrolase [Clostridia bacterium]|nr:HAD-IIB family hydrolase [Clostridia bacterium]
MKSAAGLVIVTDMDGTLLNSDGYVPRVNLEAIEIFKEAGGRFTLASGRYGKALDRLFPEYREYVNAPAILCNGAQLCDVAMGEIIREVKRSAVEVIPMLYDLEKRFPKLEIHPIIKCGETGKSIELSELTEDDECLKIVTGAEPELLDRVREYFLDNYANNWSESKSCKHLLEFLIPNATKGSALSYLRDHLKNIDGECKIIAVGDYENDIDMLLAADIAACPENAVDSVKSISKLQLCHHNDGCIADLINKII